LARRYVKEESKYYSLLASDANKEPNPPRAGPFELFPLESYCSLGNEVRRDEEPFERLPDKINQLVLVWRTEVYKKPSPYSSSSSSSYNSKWNDTKFRTLRGESGGGYGGGGAEEADEEEAGDHFDADMVDRVDLTHMGGDVEVKRLSIYDCLDKYIEREQMDEAETYKCIRCERQLAPVKKMDIYSAPDVLMLHLKR